MFDLDAFIDECCTARREDEPLLAIRDVLDRAMRDPDAVAATLPMERAEIVPLHRADDLSVLKVVWAPGMRFGPHDHLMWAAIGLYSGQEDNTFYRRRADGVEQSGGKELRVGDVALLGDDTIHAITNPRRSFTGAIHIYGGDLTTRTGRTEWDEATGSPRPASFERTQQLFAAANAALAEER